MYPRLRNYLFIMLCFVIHTQSGFGQFSPGELAKKHQYLSGNQYCAECHSQGKTVDADDCLKCHTPIQNRMNQKSGYHGIDNKMNCIKCHSDHNGVQFQMIFWEIGKENFKHEETGYVIEGKHKELACEKCHTQKYVLADDVINWETDTRNSDFLNTTFLGIPVECAGCHEDIHVNETLLREYSIFTGKVCTDCHNQTNWKEASTGFDHSKTKFPLKLSHIKQTCIKCHPDGRNPEKIDLTFFDTYEKLTCIKCHKDIHQGSYGNTCEGCHAEDDWKKPLVFDHNKTKFPIKEKHSTVLCAKCHIPNKLLEKNPLCRDCHEDKHQNQFYTDGRWKDCSPCHQETGWMPSYFSFADHDRSQFQLAGAHQAIPCMLCHQVPEDSLLTVRYSGIDRLCSSCHKDTHNNQFSVQILQNDCTTCHTTTEWKISPFDHSQTRYPLDGKHINVACEKCHKLEDVVLNGAISSVIRYRPLGSECIDCHLGQLYK